MVVVGLQGVAIGQVMNPAPGTGVKLNSVRPAQPPRPAEEVVKGPAKLIPRAAIFGNPEKAGAQISPDGTKISFLAPVGGQEGTGGVMNIWVGPVSDLSKAAPVTKETKRGVRRYFWAHTSGHLVYLQDNNGDENWHAFSVDLSGNTITDLTPYEKVSAQIKGVSPRFADEVVIGMNDRNPSYHDLYRVNVRTGARSELIRNDEYLGFDVDQDFKIRFAQKTNLDGGVEEFKAVEKDGQRVFENYGTIPFEDVKSTSTIGFDKTGNVRYVIDTRGRNTGAVMAVDLTTDKSTLMFQDDRTDAGTVLMHPTERTVQAVVYNFDKPKWGLLDKALEKDWQFIRKNSGEGELTIPSRSMDDRYWIVEIAPDNASSRTFLYDRGVVEGVAGTAGEAGTAKMTMLFVSRPALQGYALAKMEPVSFKSRDGLEMMCYLTLPVGSDMNADKLPDRPLPLVLYVHGGPWARDVWGFNPTHQWLANRGYAVLSVNYRGSTGFGKKHIMASKREWGGKMHDDLLDAVKTVVDGKIADPARIAIVGGSYGGYATLVGLTFTPDTFACGVNIVGVSNLTTFMKTIPAYWKPFLNNMRQMVGDDTTEEGKAFLLSRSPISKVDQIKKPLLIAQGARDPRVNKDESDQIVKAMKAKNIPVTYVVYPDEGHGFARPENRMSFYAIAEAFLAQHLGKGDQSVRSEPVGSSFDGSSLKIEEGAAEVMGVKDAASK